MKPIALQRGATTTSASELALTLEHPGAGTLARVLEAFGFDDVTVRSGGALQPLDEIGAHELALGCVNWG